MFKTGIYQRDRLTMTALQGFFGRRKYVAVTLYPEVASGNDPDRDRLLEHILCRFSTANGTFKRTQSHRFDEFDAHVVRMLETRWIPGEGHAVHDMAVSDGRTAVEFFHHLRGLKGIAFQFLATDAFTDLTVLSRPQKALTVVIDPQVKKPVQVIRPPFVFNVEKHESGFLYPLNRIVLDFFLRTGVQDLLQRFEKHDPAIHVEPIRLLAPECLRLLNSEETFRFERYSILESPIGHFDLIRAMNVLNPSYFSEANLRTAVANIHASLQPGGLFVTGSNQDAGSVVNGGVYDRTDQGFVKLWVSGSGSPIDPIISSFKRPETEGRG